MTIEKSPAAPVIASANTKASAAPKGVKSATLASDKTAGQPAFSSLLCGLVDPKAAGGDTTAARALTADAATEVGTDAPAGSAVALLAQQDWIQVSMTGGAEAALGEKDLSRQLVGEPQGAVSNASPRAKASDAASELRKSAVADQWGPWAEDAPPGGGPRGATVLTIKASKAKLLAERDENGIGMDKANAMRANGFQSERSKSTAEVVSPLDVARTAGMQTGSELSLNGANLLSEFRREKAIFKSMAAEANAASSASNAAEWRQPVTHVDALQAGGAVGTSFTDQAAGAYWVSGDMKNAEMKLEGIGDGSLEVSISLHGKETHVSFRTDEAQTRAALEEAGPTLKDMLQREGLELSEVSIGFAGTNLGSGARGEQKPQSRSDYRSFKLDSAGQVVEADKLRPSGVRRSGGLDVFV